MTRTSRFFVKTLCSLLSFSAAAVYAAQVTSVRVSGFSYDSVTGLLNKEVIEPNNGAYCVSTSYQPDTWGNKASATVAAPSADCGVVPTSASFTSRTTGTAFNAQSVNVTMSGTTVTFQIPAGTYPTTVTNALTQSETKLFDPRFGAVTSLTGPNQLTTNWKLDDFGRKTLEIRADGTRTAIDYCFIAGKVSDTSSNTPNCSALATTGAPSLAVMFIQNTPQDANGVQSGPYSRVYYDSLNREIRSETQSFDGNGQPSRLIVKDTTYNNFGAIVAVSQPYFLDTGTSLAAGSGAAGSGAAGSGAVGKTFTDYDALGRPRAVYVTDPSGLHFAPNGATASRTLLTYQGLKVTVTNDKGQNQVKEKNPVGQVVRTTDTTGAQLASLYDPFGNLLKTVDALGNTVVMTYDTRGRKATMNDPDTGLWQYGYNALGEMTSQQNPTQRAVSKQTTLSYDLLGRIYQRVEPEYTSTYTYDSCIKGVGKLCQVDSTNGVTRKTVYDSLGRVSQSQLVVTNGPTFTSKVDYDPVKGRVIAQTYPTGVKVAYGYTALGYLEKLSNGATNAMLWQAKKVNAWGKAEEFVHGNNVTTKTAYIAQTGQVQDIGASPSGSSTPTVFHHTYTYDSLNNLATRADANGAGNAQAVTETYFYDDINRLKEYRVASPTVPGMERKVTLEYNAIGNILSKSDVGSYSYNASGGVRPHAVNTVAGVTYSYDANGNMTGASAGKYQQVSYTSFNLPDSTNGLLGRDGTRYTWQYDAEHQRVKETHTNAQGTRTTWYMHPDNQGGLSYEQEIATDGSITNRHYLTAGGIAVGMLTTTGSHTSTSATIQTKIEYWHKDHLGSIAAITDQNAAVQRFAYDPFGKRRYTDGQYDANGNLVVDYPNGSDRGFTGHEHLDDVGVIHMNGRIYDPNIGRFMQTDPFIQAPDSLQNYNRYSYVMNNPLNATDPSGQFFVVDDMVFLYMAAATVAARAVGIIDTRQMRQALGFIAMLYIGGQGAAFGGGDTGTLLANVAAGSVGGAISSGVDGAAMGAFNAAMFTAAGSAAEAYGLEGASHAMVHGVTGCVSASVGGGKCGQGAFSSAFTTYVGGKMKGYLSNPAEELIARMAIGGTVSAIGGGKFGNGAKTAAYVYLFNELSHLTTMEQRGYPTTWWEEAVWDAEKMGLTADGCIKTDGPTMCFGGVTKGVRGAAAEFFEGTRYSERVLGQMKSGDFHGFPRMVENFAEHGTVSTVIQPSTGQAKEMLTIPGTLTIPRSLTDTSQYKTVKGVFEFIKHESGVIYHRLFRPSN